MYNTVHSSNFQKHAVLTMENVIVSFKAALKPCHFVLTLLHLARLLSFVFTKVSLTSDISALMYETHT